MNDDVADLDEVVFLADGVPLFYGRDGEALSLRAWADAFEDLAGRMVARTVVGDVEVLTIWTGLDANPRYNGRPLIFASAIRRDGWNISELETSTEADALVAHEELVTRAHRHTVEG